MIGFFLRGDRIYVLASTERPTICADVGLASTNRVRVLTSGGRSGFARPQSRKDNDAIPHQSGDRAADRFIPASFARFDTAMVRTLGQTRIHQPRFKADLESQSSRRLRRECQRNIELVWLTGRLMPDFKTLADFRQDNGEATFWALRDQNGFTVRMTIPTMTAVGTSLIIR
jgi:hypothetical protein